MASKFIVFILLVLAVPAFVSGYSPASAPTASSLAGDDKPGSVNLIPFAAVPPTEENMLEDILPASDSIPEDDDAAPAGSPGAAYPPSDVPENVPEAETETKNSGAAGVTAPSIAVAVAVVSAAAAAAAEGGGWKRW